MQIVGRRARTFERSAVRAAIDMVNYGKARRVDIGKLLTRHRRDQSGRSFRKAQRAKAIDEQTRSNASTGDSNWKLGDRETEQQSGDGSSTAEWKHESFWKWHFAGAYLQRELERGIHVPEYPKRNRPAKRDVARAVTRDVVTGDGERKDGTASHTRLRKQASNPRRDNIRNGVHVVRPAERNGSRAKPASMNRCRQHMRRARTADCHDCISWPKPSQQELEGPRFVATTYRGVEVVPLYPELSEGRCIIEFAKW